MRQVDKDALSPLGLRILEGLYETQITRRGQCSRQDFAAGFIALALHHKLRMYFDATDAEWAMWLLEMD